MGYGYGYGPHWGMMGSYGGGFGMFIWPIILIAIVALVVWLVRSTAPAGTLTILARRPAGLDVLEERYARGEIDRDEYLQKKKDIGG
jgi:putative membrane protein